MKNIMEEIEEKRGFLWRQSLQYNRKHPEKWRNYYQKLKIEISKHAPALLRTYRKAYKVNEYGAVEKDERGPEIARFFSSIGLYDFDDSDPYCTRKASDLTRRWCEIQTRKSKQTDAAPDNGHDFEHWVAAKLVQAGWKATVTQANGDDGVDVIAERKGLSVAVQCKRYKGSVGNKAVQEVYSGMKHMELDRAVVISTGKYTKAAQNLATTTGVLLLSEHDISHLWKILSVK
jgi:restriction system protein